MPSARPATMSRSPGTRLDPSAVTAKEMFRAGAAGLAAIGLFTAPGPSGRFDGIRRVVGEIRRSYAENHVQRG